MNNCGLTIWAKSIDEEAVLIQYKELDVNNNPILISYPILEINYEDMSLRNCVFPDAPVCYFHIPVQFEQVVNNIHTAVYRQSIYALDKTVRKYCGTIIKDFDDIDVEVELFIQYLKKNQNLSENTVKRKRKCIKTLLKIGVSYRMTTDEAREYLLQHFKRSYAYELMTVFKEYKKFRNADENQVFYKLLKIPEFIQYLKDRNYSRGYIRRVVEVVINLHKKGFSHYTDDETIRNELSKQLNKRSVRTTLTMFRKYKEFMGWYYEKENNQ